MDFGSKEGIYYLARNPQIVSMPPMKIPDWEGKYFFIYAVSGMLITVDDPIRFIFSCFVLSFLIIYHLWNADHGG